MVPDILERLGMKPTRKDFFNCVGTTKKGRRCEHRPSEQNVDDATHQLREIRAVDLGYLESIAAKLLCQETHQNQARAVALKWRRQLRNASATAIATSPSRDPPSQLLGTTVPGQHHGPELAPKQHLHGSDQAVSAGSREQLVPRDLPAPGTTFADAKASLAKAVASDKAPPQPTVTHQVVNFVTMHATPSWHEVSAELKCRSQAREPTTHGPVETNVGEEIGSKIEAGFSWMAIVVLMSFLLACGLQLLEAYMVPSPTSTTREWNVTYF